MECDTVHPLRRYRKARKLSLDALAASVGMTKQSLSRIELWQQPPSVDLIRRVYTLTNGEVSLADMIFVPAESSSPPAAEDCPGA